MLTKFRRWWKWYKAVMRLDMEAVCELSQGKGLHNDYHDYDDTEHGYPLHFAVLRCKRCGKEFTI